MIKYFIRNPGITIFLIWFWWVACLLLMAYCFYTGHWILGIVAFVAAVIISKLTVSKTPPLKK